MTAFNKNYDDLVKVYCEVLSTRNVDTFYLADVVDEMIETHEKLPSVYSVIQMVGKKKFISAQPDADKFDQELSRESNRLVEVETDCLKVVGQDGIDKFISFWLKYVYGADFEANMTGWGVGKLLFKKPALFDLHQASFDPKRAVVIGQKKMQEIIQKREKLYS